MNEEIYDVTCCFSNAMGKIHENAVDCPNSVEDDILGPFGIYCSQDRILEYRTKKRLLTAAPGMLDLQWQSRSSNSSVDFLESMRLVTNYEYTLLFSLSLFLLGYQLLNW